MNVAEISVGILKKPNPFKKYGLEFTPDGKLNGPKRPALFGKTPELHLQGIGGLNLATNRPFLEKVFNNDRFSVVDDREQLMDVVGKIFTAATGNKLNEYTNFVFMERSDWEKFSSRTVGDISEGKNADAIHLGGLVVVGAEADDRILPLLFHESGHALYPPNEDRFTDEFRAYYFQRIATEILHLQLGKLGLPYTYPNYFEDDKFPTKTHKDAYQSAATLYINQLVPDLQKDDASGFNQQIQNLLALVKPRRGVKKF